MGGWSQEGASGLHGPFLGVCRCPVCGGPVPHVPLDAINLSRVERAMVEIMADGKARSAGQIVSLVYADDPWGGPLAVSSIVSQTVARANRKLEPSGWRIGSSKAGYQLALVKRWRAK